MSKRPSRGVSSGVGSPTRMTGRDGDLTIRKTKKGKILYVKEHGSWHPINTGVDVAQMKKDVDRLIRSVNTLRNDNNPYPTINALNIRKNVATATVDPKITFTVAGTDIFTMGVNDSLTSPANPFQINSGSTLDDTSKFELDASGNIEAAGNINIASDKKYKINGSDLSASDVGGVAASLFDAHTILYSVSDNTPVALTVGARTIVGREATGNIVAMNKTAALGILNVADGADVTGSNNAASATILETTRTIGGVSFNGSGNINLPGVNLGGNQNTSGSAATLTTARTIYGGSFDGSANIAGDIVIGSGSGEGTVKGNGSYNLILRTNHSSGASYWAKIILNDGSNGNIELTPNGTGKTLSAKPIGFTHYASPTPSDGDDCDINFASNGNKSRMTFTGDDITVADARLIFPTEVSGNYTVLVKTHSSVTKNLVTTWTSHYGAADTDAATVKWQGGAKPTITQTANRMDVFSFYWDSDEKVAYGAATQGFQ